MADFFAMGGYADFVWAAYGLTAAVLTVLVAASLRRLKALEGDLAAAAADANADGDAQSP
jgi:heme exporter protein D